MTCPGLSKVEPLDDPKHGPAPTDLRTYGPTDESAQVMLSVVHKVGHLLGIYKYPNQGRRPMEGCI